MPVFTYDAITAVYAHLRHVPNRYLFLRAGQIPEVGGLLLGRKGVVHSAAKVPNVAKNPLREFSPSARAMSSILAEYERTGQELLGTYHDHPWGQAVMSGADAALAAESGLLLIVAAPWECDPQRWQWRLYDPAAGGEVDLRIAPPLASI